MRWAIVLTLLASWAPVAGAQAPVTTSQYNNARTGADVHESVLTSANVNARQFGKVFALPVDGDIYAQPLYLPQVNVPGRGRHNIVFVATEHDSVYAFDAGSGAQLWHTSFLGPDIIPIRAGVSGCPMISPDIGITSTPVIDPASGTLYVLARTREHGSPVQRLHALDVSTGQEKLGGPVAITALGFDPMLENPRSALLLAGNILYLSWGSTCDYGAYHGWMMAYDAHSLKQLATFNSSPDSVRSAFWAADAGIAADADGNVFAATGNGIFDVVSGGRDYGDSLLRLSLGSDGLAVRDYFTPYNQAALNRADADLGSGGPVLLPGHLVLIGGKGGVWYLIDADHMGKFHAGDDSNAVETLPVSSRGPTSGQFGAPAYWNHHIFVISFVVGDGTLKDYAFQNGRISTQPGVSSTSKLVAVATPTVSSNGDHNGIVWVIESTVFFASGPDRPAVLHAYAADNIAHEIYNSEQNPGRDRPGLALRFTIPTVADGRVYVGTKDELDVYGLLPASQRSLATVSR